MWPTETPPIVFAFVLSLSFLLLLVVFRSLVIAAKAIIMNLLSVSASYGLLVPVLQKGFATGLFGFQQADVHGFSQDALDGAIPSKHDIRSSGF